MVKQFIKYRGLIKHKMHGKGFILAVMNRYLLCEHGIKYRFDTNSQNDIYVRLFAGKGCGTLIS